MKALCMAMILLSGTTALAQPVPVDAPWQDRPVADLRGLDKVTASAKEILVKAGTAATFGSLTISVRSCKIRAPDQPPDATAFLDVVDSRGGAADFHGWIFANEPSINLYQHAVYDIRLIGCRAS